MNGALLTRAYESLVRPVLFRVRAGDPEAIHEDMIRLLCAVGNTPVRSLAKLICGAANQPFSLAGVQFAGPVGLAAGMDKDGMAARMWATLGFGFAELGTVTAQAQPGNPKPRVFRLKHSRGLINRMGFNNASASALAGRLAALGVQRGRASLGIPLGISIGKTKVVDVDQAVGDYVSSLTAVHRVADYVAVNVSSPNTPGLRGLQSEAHILELVGALVTHAATLDPHPVPIFVKMAPDLHDADLDALLEAAERAGASGLIATNTTLARDNIRQPDAHYARQAGGMSGAPLSRRARRIVTRVVAHSSLPVIASGGIMTPDDALAMLDAGASAVQVYTGFIYSGPGLVAEINRRCHARILP